MKVGIIVHSQTGNTLDVAEKLKSVLMEKDMEVVLERIIEEDLKAAQQGKVVLKNIPDTKDYDVLIFGGPVWAFSPSFVMSKYLHELPDLKGKKIACFVTQSFPYPWLGGNRAAKIMANHCRNKGGEVYATGSVSYTKKGQRRLGECIDQLCDIK
ncbi:MAG: flavodoxin [Acholeplasmataceae bacterium]|nr:flavodoxin [Acholeplasmataceae bacterium]